MATVNDLKFTALGALGHTGTVRERELSWLQSLGATSDTYNDAWREVGLTVTPAGGDLNELKQAYFLANGGTGESYSDIEYSFWENL